MIDKHREIVCKGCRSYRCDQHGDSKCAIKLSELIDGLPCPCSICIIKMMCDTPCRAFSTYLLVDRNVKNERKI